MTVALQFEQRLLPLYTSGELRTPAFVYDESAITAKLELLADVRRCSGCSVLYSIKALSFPARSEERRVGKECRL